MSKRIKRIVQVLKEPENLIVIVGVLVSIVLAYYGIQHNSVQQAVTAILAILGSLAVAQIIAGYAAAKRDKQVEEILSLLKESKDLHVSSDQLEASRELIEFVERNKPERADLIELSSATVDSLMESLKRVNCHVRLLIQDPDHAVTDYQKRRIQQRIRDLLNLTLKEYPRFEVRLYAVPSSIRGRLIGEDIINIGWYTYSSDEIGVYGHVNPLITTRASTQEGRILCKMFQRSFDWLWNHPKTVALGEAIEQTIDKAVQDEEVHEA